jgi:hypothetical protein
VALALQVVAVAVAVERAQVRAVRLRAVGRQVALVVARDRTTAVVVEVAKAVSVPLGQAHRLARAVLVASDRHKWVSPLRLSPTVAVAAEEVVLAASRVRVVLASVAMDRMTATKARTPFPTRGQAAAGPEAAVRLPPTLRAAALRAL